MMTQPGETDEFTASDHIKTLNSYLGEKKISTVIANNGQISKEIIEKYQVAEQKDPVIVDKKELEALKIKVIEDDFVSIQEEKIRYHATKLGLAIFAHLTL